MCQGYETIQTIGRVAATFATSLDTAIEQLVETLTVSDTAGTQPRTPGSVAGCAWDYVYKHHERHICCTQQMVMMHCMIPLIIIAITRLISSTVPPMQPPRLPTHTSGQPLPRMQTTPAKPLQGHHQHSTHIPGRHRGGSRLQHRLHSLHLHQLHQVGG